MSKKVSIIIPVYKNIHFLKKSLSSAVNQTYKNTEIIIVNDGNNKDDKQEIYKIINNLKKNIIVVNLKKNQGVSNALNEGIKKSTGSYLSWLSHDDYFHIKKIEMQIDYLEKRCAKICSCDFVEINKIDNFKIDRILDDKYFDDQVLSIILNDSLHGCSLLIHKDCFDGFSFNKKYKHIQDYDIWNRMSEKYQFVHLKKKLLYSNKHVSQSSYIKKDESISEKLKFYESLIDEKLLFYNFNRFGYVFKFIYRSILIYKSPALATAVLKKFLFYNLYNYFRLYIKRN